jgi:hypothetical protein
MQHLRFDDDNSIDVGNDNFINTTSLQYSQDDIIACCNFHEDDFITLTSRLEHSVFDEVHS